MYRHFHLAMLASCFVISIDDDILLMSLLLCLVWWCSSEVWWFAWRCWFCLFIWAMGRLLLLPSCLFHCCNISYYLYCHARCRCYYHFLYCYCHLVTFHLRFFIVDNGGWCVIFDDIPMKMMMLSMMIVLFSICYLYIGKVVSFSVLPIPSFWW